MLANDIIGFHTHAYCINFIRCCDELLEADVDYERCIVRHAGGQTLAAAPTRSGSTPSGCGGRPRSRREVAEAEREVLERRRKHLIIRVDRADLSKNVLRGFTAFDTFLTQHPEFREQVTFIAHLQPSRQDVPEYAEYLERIEALVAVVNHRHGTTDWMPIDLKIYENFPEAVARYKHFDLLMVNSIFDGMNLVAKEAPAVNTRDGVLMLSENTGSHEELGRLRDLGQPLRHPGAGRRDLPGADDGPRGAQGPRPAPEGDHLLPQPRRLGRRPAGRHRRAARVGLPENFHFCDTQTTRLALGSGIMEAVREKWTDERLDDLSRKVDDRGADDGPRFDVGGPALRGVIDASTTRRTAHGLVDDVMASTGFVALAGLIVSQG